MNNKTILFMIITAMTLGTAWAVRGKFGHEQGAAWAGAIGGIVIVLLSGRKDWYQKIYTVALAAAIGWGMGGMCSYGLLVGYGNANDFPNAIYGFAMLFVVGALYGVTGGGLLGLALSHTKERKVDWARVITEMTIGGFLAYGFLIAQLGWAMTPPRSELWAGCFGAGLALIWYLYRNNYTAPLKVALFATIGGGFGFASGEFWNVLFIAYEVPFSGWNTMEYSIGFWGGLGMAYGIFTSKWDGPKVISNLINPVSSKVALLSVALIIPMIIWQQSFIQQKFIPLVESLNWQNVEAGTTVLRLAALVLILAMAAFLFYRFFRNHGKDITRKEVFICFISLFAVYILLSDIRTASYFSWQPIEQKLYWINFIIILSYVLKDRKFDWSNNIQKINYLKFLIVTTVALVTITLLTFVAINTHGPEQGGHQRFPVGKNQ